jgi:hypothetical protein
MKLTCWPKVGRQLVNPGTEEIKMRILCNFRNAAALAGVLIISAGTAHAIAGKSQPISVSFVLTADGKEVGCGALLHNLGSGRLETKLHEARFYVYGVKLIDAKGVRTPVALDQSEWQYGDVALLDFKDARGGNASCTQGNPAKNTTIVGSAQAGSYVGLEFDLTTLFENSDIVADKGGAVGCMSTLDDPECPAIFVALGLNLGDSVAGTHDGGKQTKPGVSSVFKVGAATPRKVVGAKQ